ncbi:MAG: hypothetical protein K9G62_04870 [Alphaproteobacteria bacterium]|nr:hypothetical protein [Alphaproteobacteria bacterium]
MIDKLSSIPTVTHHNPAGAGQAKKILTMVQNDRTAGSIPAWVDAPRDPSADGPRRIEDVLSAALKGDAMRPFENAFAPRPGEGTQSPGTDGGANPDEFTFADVLDMVNPLQHIPVVGHFYRAFTGDTIKPAGKLIGGAVFGGALGAATGALNIILQAETGMDAEEHALSFLGSGKRTA